MTTDHQFSDDLRDLLADHGNELRSGTYIRDVFTYSDAEILTYNAGLLVRLDDGTEFQITIVRSR